MIRLFLNPRDEVEVFNMFQGLKNSKSIGIDKLQTKSVKF